RRGMRRRIVRLQLWGMARAAGARYFDYGRLSGDRAPGRSPASTPVRSRRPGAAPRPLDRDDQPADAGWWARSRRPDGEPPAAVGAGARAPAKDVDNRLGGCGAPPYA